MAKKQSKPQVTLPSKTFQNNSPALQGVCRSLDYIDSGTLYEDVDAYRYFIGSEIDSNSIFGLQIVERLLANGFPEPKRVVETAAGTGASIRDLNRILPNAELICLEISEKLCQAGLIDNPHLVFRAQDMIAFALEKESVDLVFNSASSLGFLNINQLSEHIKNVGTALTKHGRYFADVGFYSSPQAANLAWNYNYFSKRYAEHNGKEVMMRVIEPSLTLRYYPTTDCHDICYSTWQKPVRGAKHAEFEHQKGYVHNLRAYRFSEIKFLAELHGLNARLWYYTEDRTGIDEVNESWKVGKYSYQLCDDSFYLEDSDECAALLVEIYKDSETPYDLKGK